MRIIYSEGFHLDERKEIRQVIFSNMIVAFKIIAEAMREMGLEYDNAESQVGPLSVYSEPYAKLRLGIRTNYRCC